MASSCWGSGPKTLRMVFSAHLDLFEDLHGLIAVRLMASEEVIGSCRFLLLFLLLLLTLISPRVDTFCYPGMYRWEPDVPAVLCHFS